MATDNKSKDPTNTNTAVNPDVEPPASKRRVIDLLPTVNKTETLKKFFDASIDNLFQPADYKKISGYIGRKPGYWDTDKDFYLNEITQSRIDYQLEPAAISKNADTGDITNILFYEDLINLLRFQGGITNDHNRLFEQEYYSWAPPIDLDKITAYWNYFWLPEGPTIIEITDPTDVNNALIGLQYPDPSDPVFGENGVASATSGLRIRLTNDATALRNGIDYIIEGVGREIILVEDTFSASAAWDSPPGTAWDVAGWDVGGTNVDTPDYIVMERGAKDNNQWSVGNRWFHRDVILQSGTTVFSDISNLQATRPIIEFVRDIELYNFSANTVATVDLVYEGTDLFSHLNGYQVWTAGDFSDGTSTPPTDWINGQHGLVRVPAYFDQNGTPRTEVDGFPLLRDGMKLLVTSDTNPAVNNKVYTVGGIQNTGVVNLIDSGVVPVTGDQVSIRYGKLYGSGLFILSSAGWIDGQRKLSVNQAPLFQLYDIDQVRLDDPGVYPVSDFNGDEIFSFQINPAGVSDSVLGLQLTYDEFGEIVYENFLVTNRYNYNSPEQEITGFYFFRIIGDTTDDDIYSNSWNQIATRTQQYILQEEYLEDGQDPYIPLVTEPGTPETGGLPTLIVTVDGRRLEESEYFVDTNFTSPINIPGAVLVLSGDPGNFVQIKLFNKDYRPDDYVHWEIPLNLQANPDNLEVETISAGQYFDHFSEIINNQENIDGEAFSINNWRDTPQTRSLGRQIMQHRAPMLKLMILGSTENLDFMLSSRYVEREYSRTRNKLIQKFSQFHLNSTYLTEPPSKWVSDALLQINVGKTNSFPFYYSGMIAEGSFIPSTPSRLGIYPTYKPVAYLDDTFTTPTWNIRGHDGSQYIMFSTINGGGPTDNPADCIDPRDAAYLEYENQVYASIPAGYKTENVPDYNYKEFTPGKFRQTDYTRQEVVSISQPMFERWVATKGADYRTNDGWSPDNKFTWNYHSSLDRDGESVPGHWRGMYNWYFDTDRPHTHPWEMLGFSEQPSWWVIEYGPAPWTGGNTLMWQDLENGYVRQGPRQGINEIYARPGLTGFIPVDPSGKLLDPVRCGIIPQNPTYNQGKTDWVYGDQGPIENVWVKSEFYPYAVAQTSYLMKPARFIELGWDPDRWSFVFEDTEAFQWVNTETRDRPNNADLVVHGETISDGSVYIGSGIQQWISNWVTSRGQNITTQFGNIIRGLGVQLAHKMGGYTNSNDLRLLTDNFGLIPSEDIEVVAHLSPSIKETIYSGVIIEWSGTGWVVYGYDILNPVFNTIPGDPAGRKTWIKVGETDIELPDRWASNVAYAVGDRTRYQGVIYEATVEHTSGNIFVRDSWRYIGTDAPDQGIRVQEYLDANPDMDVSVVPYGTEFKTQQTLYNFLIDYERWLENEGWIFEEVDDVTNDTKNFRRAGKEYLTWSLNSWSEGSFIALSPAANQVKFATEQGAIQSVERLIRGVYPLLDKTGVKINPFDTNVTRYDDTLCIEPEDETQGIYCCRLSIKEFEHVLTTNNVTIFNDLIYDVLFNVRQPRFTINGILTNQWNGRLDAPGFIVNSDAIYSNYEKTVSDFKQYFAIEDSPSNPTLREHARHLVGFQFRDYLQALLVDPDVSFQFYQGMIQAKGTPSSLGELIKTERFDEQEKLDFFEEWAFRLGNFGATDIRPSIEIQLDRSEIRNNPQLIEFSCFFQEDNPFDRSIQLGPYDDRWLRKPQNMDQQCSAAAPNLDIWPLRGKLADELYDLPSAGYVRIDEIDYYRVNSAELTELYTEEGFINLPDLWQPLTVYSLDDQVLFENAIYQALETHTSGATFNDDRSKWEFVSPIPQNGLKERDTIWLYDTDNIVDPGQFGVFRITDTSATVRLFTFGSITIELNNTPTPALNTNPNIIDVEYNEDNIGLLRDLKEAGDFDITKINPGDFILIPDETQSSPNLQGIHRVTKIIDSTTFEIEGDLDTDFDYIHSDFDPPRILFLQNMRVADIDEKDAVATELNGSATPLADDELIWVDDARSAVEIDDQVEKYWAVYSYDSGSFSDRIRRQERRVDSKCLVNGVVYNKRTNRITTWLEAYDPRKGILPGVADKELWYKLEYDPAKYTDGDDSIHQIDPELAWGPNEVGRLWWDISTVKYLDYEIGDNIYRDSWWGKIAPGTSVDVYEWVRSPNEPTNYSSIVGQDARPQVGASTRYSGDVKDVDNPAWVSREEYDNASRQTKIYYYFWVKNVETVPDVPFRKVNAIDVAKIIENPTLSGINWFCPITDQALTVANAEQFLVDDDTVLQINWKDSRLRINRQEVADDFTTTGADYKLTQDITTICNDDANIHRQWDLMREGDKSSQPDDMLWKKLKDSLVGFNDLLEPVPDPALSDVERYGTLFRPRQTWFESIFGARQVFVQAANTLLLQSNIVSTRSTWDNQLYDEEAEPTDEIFTEVASVSGQAEYISPKPFSNASQVIVTVNAVVQTQGTAYNAVLTNKIVFEPGYEPNAGDIIEITIKAYDYNVVDVTARDALVGTILPGQIVLVQPTLVTNSRWTLWLYQPSVPPIPTWQLLQVQNYKMEDSWYLVDWYATGYSADTDIDFEYPDSATFATAQLTETYADGDVVKVNDIGDGRWNLFVFDDTIFVKVAEQEGTIQLNDIFYTYQFNEGDDIYGYDSTGFESIPFDQVAELLPYPFRELSTIIDALKDDILINLEINLLFFSMIRYVHSEQNMIDWVFKTSYIYLIGTEEELSQTPLLRDDITDDFIDYINEAKPYHVKIRDFQQNKRVPTEIYNCLATDFDNPPYYDADQDAYRPLELENPADVGIFESERPWSEWYEDYQAGPGPAVVGPNVRKFTTQLHFDRLKCWTDMPIPGVNSNSLKLVSNAPAGEYVIFTVTSSKMVVTEVDIAVQGALISSHVGNGIQKTFAAPKIILQPETLTVLLNGVPQVQGTDFVIVQNGLSVEFLLPPSGGDTIDVNVDESFDDPLAYVTIGDSDVDSAGLVSSVEGTLNIVSGSNTFNPNKSYNYDTNIIVDFNPGLSTKGIVTITVTYELDINLIDLTQFIVDAADRVALLYNPSLDREKKQLAPLPGQERIKGTTLTSSDLVSEEFYRTKYKVSPISECDYRGMIYRSHDFIPTGFDTELFDIDDFDTDIGGMEDLDVIINGGQAIFDIYLLDVTDGIVVGPNVEYTISGVFNNPSQVFVSIDGTLVLAQGTDYTAATPNKLIFPNPVSGTILQVVVAPFGTTFVPAPLNDSDIVIEGHQFLQPHYDDDHPEELVKTSPYSSLCMSVFYDSIAGCPIIMTDRIISDGSTVEYPLLQVPQNKKAVWVYINGEFATLGVDFVFDQTANSVKINPAPVSGTPIKITTFSPGGNKINQQLYAIGDGSAGQQFYLNSTTIMQNVTAFINGEGSTFTLNWDPLEEKQYVQFVVDPTLNAQVQITVFEPPILERQYDNTGLDTFTLTTTPVTTNQIQVLVNKVPAGFILAGQDVMVVPSPVSGDDVLVTVYEIAEISTVRTDTFTASVAGSELFVLTSPIQTTRPMQSVIFVRKNGLRLDPEHTQYQNAAPNQTEYEFPEAVDTSMHAVRVWINDVQQSNPTNYTLNYVSGSIADKIVFTTPLTGGEQISIIVDKDEAEFEVVNPTTIQVYDVQPNDLIQVSYFTYDGSYNFKTEKFKQNLEGIYPLAQAPFGADYIWVHVNGQRMMINRDYLLDRVRPGFDSEYLDIASFDSETIGDANVVMNPYIGDISAYGTHPDAIIDATSYPSDILPPGVVVQPVSTCVTTSPYAGWDAFGWDSEIDLTLPDPPIGPTTKVIQTYNWDCGLHDPALPWFDTAGFDAEFLDGILKDEIVVTTVAGPPVRRKFAYKTFTDKFDEITFSRISDPHKLSLRQDLLWKDNVGTKDKEILLNINPNLHKSMIPDDLLYVPTGTTPGVLYINGERIEYWEVEKLTDIDGTPYYRIPYREVTYSDPPRIEKLPKFLRRTKATSIGAPEFINGVLNTELKIPEGTLVIPGGPKQIFGLPFEQAGEGSLQMVATSDIIVGDGNTTTFPLPVVPSHATITSAWLITGPNPEDRELITDFTLTETDIIFGEAPTFSEQVEIVGIDIDSFDLAKINNSQTIFLRSTFGTYENKINN